MMKLTEELLYQVAMECNGNLKAPSQNSYGMETEIDLTPPFKRWTLFEAIERHTGKDVGQLKTREEAVDLAREISVDTEERLTLDQIIMEIFEQKVEDQLVQPTFIYDFPADYCPLTKKHRSDPMLAERFELYINRLEYVNAYSELTDPKHQAQQFELQRQRHALGDLEAHPTDEDYVIALQCGLPPTGGMGLGIDRLVMLLTQTHNIKDVILFPLQR